MVNQGGGEFEDQADEFGVRQGGWGWAASLSDFNNDGRPDLIHTTQNVVTIDQEDPHHPYPMVWQNNGSGFTSLDASDRGFDKHDGRGMVTLDYDRDGDQDIVTVNYNQPYVVYENTVNETNSVQFRAVGDDGEFAPRCHRRSGRRRRDDDRRPERTDRLPLAGQSRQPRRPRIDRQRRYHGHLARRHRTDLRGHRREPATADYAGRPGDGHRI